MSKKRKLAAGGRTVRPLVRCSHVFCDLQPGIPRDKEGNTRLLWCTQCGAVRLHRFTNGAWRKLGRQALYPRFRGTPNDKGDLRLPGKDKDEN